MENNTAKPIFKIVPEELVVWKQVRFSVNNREELRSQVLDFHEELETYNKGSPILIHLFGSYFDGKYDVDICLPVNEGFTHNDYEIKTLPPREVVSLIYTGPLAEIRNSYIVLSKYLREKGLLGKEHGREVWHEYTNDDSSENSIEVQTLILTWHSNFHGKVKEILPQKDAHQVLENYETLSVDSSKDERFDWTRDSLKRLSKVANEEQQYEILSCCGHRFPKPRIRELRAIYLKDRDIDAVLEAMQPDSWYANPRREGNVIIETKQPSDSQGYENATTRQEKRDCYCFCTPLKGRLDEMPVAYCNCGAGWYRQLWEGILGQPLKVEITKSLLKGDDVCQFTITLPAQDS
jgi:effector-binding domain-containing protein